jgi:predicted glycoside hydrolase/deacetylase ChbG (UPF0249 family)
MPAGLLIVNADDYGIDRSTSDAILECLASGSITSATAMVFMSDSRRAATEFPLGGGGGGLGLHLNLIEPYSADEVPPAVRDRQASLAAYFRRVPFAAWFYNPAIAGRVNDCIADQLDAFRELYRREPTHVDGHQHFHLCPTALASRSLRTVPKLRPAFTFTSGEKPLPNRAYRGALNALIRRHFVTPEWLVSVRGIARQLGGAGEERLRGSEALSAEVMTHPGWEDELSYLGSDAWRAELEGANLGTYADL